MLEVSFCFCFCLRVVAGEFVNVERRAICSLLLMKICDVPVDARVVLATVKIT